MSSNFGDKSAAAYNNVQLKQGEMVKVGGGFYELQYWDDHNMIVWTGQGLAGWFYQLPRYAVKVLDQLEQEQTAWPVPQPKKFRLEAERSSMTSAGRGFGLYYRHPTDGERVPTYYTSELWLDGEKAPESLFFVEDTALDLRPFELRFLGSTKEEQMEGKVETFFAENPRFWGVVFASFANRKEDGFQIHMPWGIFKAAQRRSQKEILSRLNREQSEASENREAVRKARWHWMNDNVAQPLKSRVGWEFALFSILRDTGEEMELSVELSPLLRRGDEVNLGSLRCTPEGVAEFIERMVARFTKPA